MQVADFGIAKWKYDTYMTNNNVAGGTAAYMVMLLEYVFLPCVVPCLNSLLI